MELFQCPPRRIYLHVNRLCSVDAQNSIWWRLRWQERCWSGTEPAFREGYPFEIPILICYMDRGVGTENSSRHYKQLEGVPADLQLGDAKIQGTSMVMTLYQYWIANGDDADMVSLGDNAPRYSLRDLEQDMSFKGFDFSLFLQGVAERGPFSIPDQWRLPSRNNRGVGNLFDVLQPIPGLRTTGCQVSAG